MPYPSLLNEELGYGGSLDLLVGHASESIENLVGYKEASGTTVTVTPGLYTVTLVYYTQAAIIRGARVIQGLYTVTLVYHTQAAIIRGARVIQDLYTLTVSYYTQSAIVRGARVIQGLYTVAVSYFAASIFTGGAPDNMGHTRKKRRTQ